MLLAFTARARLFLTRQPVAGACYVRACSTLTVPAALVKKLRDMTGAPMMDCKNALIADGVGGDIEKAIDWLRKKGMAAAGKKAGRATAQGLVATLVAESGETATMIEINSETDFVARNELFQSLARRVAHAALQLPVKVETQAPTGLAALDEPGLAALKGLQLPEGDSLGAPTTVGEGVVDMIAKIRENMTLRRGAVLSVPGGLVTAYTHNAVSPGLGAIGVLIGLRLAAGSAPLPAAARPDIEALARKIAMHVAAARPAYLSKANVPLDAVERERSILIEQSKASGKPEAIIAKMVEGRLGKFYQETVLTEQAFVLSEDGAKVSKLLEEGVRKATGNKDVKLELAGFMHFVVGEGVEASAAE